MSVDASGASILDQRRFISQNDATGEIRGTPLTLRQLCRILNSAVDQQRETQTPKLVSPNTQLIAIESDGSYSSEGWKPAREYPVLKEAIAQWYYRHVSNEDTGVQGPVSCRAISDFVEDQRIGQDKLQVYSDVTGSWDVVANLASLQSALLAFRSPKQDAAKAPTSTEEEVAFPGDSDKTNNPSKSQTSKQEEINDELDAFLKSTEGLGHNRQNAGQQTEENEEAYESDGGTRYLKDSRTGKWMHEALVKKATEVQQQQESQQQTNSNDTSSSKKQNAAGSVGTTGRKRKRAKFAARNAKCWIYVTGLPTDCTAEEIQQVFTKAGIIDLDPETLLPKIKLYRHKDGPNAGKVKGDASICYARPESVQLAETLLDETPLRPEIVSSSKMKVQRAKFEQRGEIVDSRGPVSNAKRQVARLAAIQARDWEEGENRLTGGRKGLRIIVVKHLFDPRTQNMNDDKQLKALERDLRSECTKFGDVEKMTVFANNVEGVVIIKFTKPAAASAAIQGLNGRNGLKEGGTSDNKQTLLASFWDGVTDYTMRDHEGEKREMEKRHEEFGRWLDEQQNDLPEELRLKTADD